MTETNIRSRLCGPGGCIRDGLGQVDSPLQQPLAMGDRPGVQIRASVQYHRMPEAEVPQIFDCRKLGKGITKFQWQQANHSAVQRF
jgi:hypothetical protein